MSAKNTENRRESAADASAARSAARLPAPHLPTIVLVSAVALAVVIATIYGRAIHAPFIFDDEDIVIKNTSIERLWPLIGTEKLRGPLNPEREISTSGRPLVNLSLAINYRFGERDPASYHFFNIGVHILSAWLLLGIVRRTLRLDFFQPSIRNAADPLACLVALVWALHPLHTETVVYVTQRTELLMSLFYLTTLYVSLRYWTTESQRSRSRWAVLAGITCTLGMACKEVMVTAPVVVLLFERTFVAGSFRAALGRSWRLYIGLALGWVVLLVLNVTGPRSGSAGFHAGVAAPVWWLTQTKILLMYLKLVAWPWPLVIQYEFPYLTTVREALPWLMPVALLAIVTLVLVWRRTAVGFALAWMFLILSPTLVVPIITEMAAERRMYLASAALITVAVVGGYALLQKIRPAVRADRAKQGAIRQPLAIVLACSFAVAVVYVALDVRRLEAYQSAISIWQDAAQYQPNNPVVQTNWGVALAAAERTSEAIEHYQTALGIDPQARGATKNLAEAYYDLGLRLLDQGKPTEAEAQLQTALGVKPDFANAHYALAGVRVAQGNLPAAAEHYATAVRLQPDYVGALVNLGIVQVNLGEEDHALQSFQEALSHDPANADAHFGLAIALAKQGKTQQASEEFQATFRSDPARADAHFELANLLVAAQDLRAAIDEYHTAVRLRPDYVQAWQNLGAASLALGDARQAIAQLNEALRLQPDNPQARTNLERAVEMNRRPAK